MTVQNPFQKVNFIERNVPKDSHKQILDVVHLENPRNVGKLNFKLLPQTERPSWPLCIGYQLNLECILKSFYPLTGLCMARLRATSEIC